jgi:hypothetical protein
MMESEAPMFFALRHVWRFWTESWSAPGRARWLYALFALGFLGLAIGGGIKGDATVIALGIVFALVTTGLAIIAPMLTKATKRGDGHEA